MRFLLLGNCIYTTVGVRCAVLVQTQDCFQCTSTLKYHAAYKHDTPPSYIIHVYQYIDTESNRAVTALKWQTLYKRSNIYRLLRHGLPYIEPTVVLILIKDTVYVINAELMTGNVSDRTLYSCQSLFFFLINHHDLYTKGSSSSCSVS